MSGNNSKIVQLCGETKAVRDPSGNYCVADDRTLHFPTGPVGSKPDPTAVPDVPTRTITYGNWSMSDQELRTTCQEECDADGDCKAYTAIFHTQDIRVPHMIVSDADIEQAYPTDLKKQAIAKKERDMNRAQEFERCPNGSQDRCVPQCVLFQQKQVEKLNDIMNKEMLSKCYPLAAPKFFQQPSAKPLNYVAPGTMLAFKHPTLC